MTAPPDSTEVGPPGDGQDVLLPWLRAQVECTPPDLRPALDEALRKFSRGDGRRPLALRLRLSRYGRETEGDARAIWAAANIRYQFVAGAVTAGRASFATRDGSVATLDERRSEVTIAATPAVFRAPYSTWSDLVASPLAEFWREAGRYVLHAAAVAVGGHRPLLVGPSGSGKTTTALALARNGGLWLADDKVLLDATAGTPAAISLYRNTNLAPDTIDAFAGLEFARRRPPIDDTNDKRGCLLEETPVPVSLATFEPTALLFLQPGRGAHSSFEPMTRADALVGLAGQSPASPVRERAIAHHRFLAVLARTLPAWLLRPGRDLLDRPEAFTAEVVSRCDHAGWA